MPSKRLTCITLTILLLILLELISSLEVLLQWEVNYYNILFFMFLFSFANMFSTLEILLWMVSQMRTSGQRWRSKSLLLQKKQKDRFLFLALLSLRATPTAYGSSQARGRIGAVATSLRQSHSNTRSEPYSSQQRRILTHWARPGIKPSSSWIVVRSVTTEPQWELPRQIHSL